MPDDLGVIIGRMVGGDQHAVLAGEELGRQLLGSPSPAATGDAASSGASGRAGRCRSGRASRQEQLHQHERRATPADRRRPSCRPLPAGRSGFPRIGFPSSLRNSISRITTYAGIACVDLAGELDEPRRHRVLAGQPRQVERVDRDAVPAEAGAGVERLRSRTASSWRRRSPPRRRSPSGRRAVLSSLTRAMFTAR